MSGRRLFCLRELPREDITAVARKLRDSFKGFMYKRTVLGRGEKAAGGMRLVRRPTPQPESNSFGGCAKRGS